MRRQAGRSGRRTKRVEDVQDPALLVVETASAHGEACRRFCPKQYLYLVGGQPACADPIWESFEIAVERCREGSKRLPGVEALSSVEVKPLQRIRFEVALECWRRVVFSVPDPTAAFSLQRQHPIAEPRTAFDEITGQLFPRLKHNAIRIPFENLQIRARAVHHSAMNKWARGVEWYIHFEVASFATGDIPVDSLRLGGCRIQ